MAQEKIVNRGEAPGLEKSLAFLWCFAKTEVRLQNKGQVGIEIFGSGVEKILPIDLAKERQYLFSALRLVTVAKQRQEKFPFRALLGVCFHFASSLGLNMLRHQPLTQASKPHQNPRSTLRQSDINSQAHTKQSLDHSKALPHFAGMWDAGIKKAPFPIH
jgi:hypothetical protein